MCGKILNGRSSREIEMSSQVLYRECFKCLVPQSHREIPTPGKYPQAKMCHSMFVVLIDKSSADGMGLIFNVHCSWPSIM